LPILGTFTIVLMHCSLLASPSSNFTCSLFSLFTVVLLGTGAVQAQGVYRIVGADGRVTFSDRPPINNAQTGAASSQNAAPGTSASSLAQLPYELRQTATRYPVTLYASKDCQPCDEARNYLQGHGVPFSERTVQTNADLDALKKLSGQENLPFATIGSQHLKGFGEDSWTQYLKAAGYPAQSTLPANYRAPAPMPLTTPALADKPKPSEPAVRAPTSAATQTTPPPGTPTPNNPAGLRF
jgi:glutaredoxin